MTAPAKTKSKIVWICQECGNRQNKWTGSCGACQNWNTLIEELSLEEKKPRFESKKTTPAKAVRIKDVGEAEFKRRLRREGQVAPIALAAASTCDSRAVSKATGLDTTPSSQSHGRRPRE